VNLLKRTDLIRLLENEVKQRKSLVSLSTARSEKSSNSPCRHAKPCLPAIPGRGSLSRAVIWPDAPCLRIRCSRHVMRMLSRAVLWLWCNYY